MTVSEQMPSAPPGQSTAAAPGIAFSTVKGFGRGYDQHEVDEFVHRQAALLNDLDARGWQTAERELAALRARLSAQPADSTVAHAVSVLTTAQETAEQILDDAGTASTRCSSAAAAQLEQSRARRGRAGVARRAERAAHLTRRTRRARPPGGRRRPRAERLTLSSDEAQQHDRPAGRGAAHFRDATHIQVHEFLDDALDNIAEQYGRAHPLAAQAAAPGLDRAAAGSASRRMMGAHRARPAPGGRPAQRSGRDRAVRQRSAVAVSNGFAPDGARCPADGAAAAAPRSPQSSERAAGVRA